MTTKTTYDLVEYKGHKYEVEVEYINNDIKITDIFMFPMHISIINEFNSCEIEDITKVLKFDLGLL